MSPNKRAFLANVIQNGVAIDTDPLDTTFVFFVGTSAFAVALSSGVDNEGESYVSSPTRSATADEIATAAAYDADFAAKVKANAKSTPTDYAALNAIETACYFGYDLEA